MGVLWYSNLLIVPVSVCITLIALRSYFKFRNWRLLFLSVAFLLLAISPTINLLINLSAMFFLSAWWYSALSYFSYIFSIATILPFSLLAYVYFNERKTQSITITRRQWSVGGAIFLVQLGSVIYEFDSFHGYYPTLGGSSYPFLVDFISGSLASLLIVLIVISLWSYYQARRSRNTLLVMTGFICLFIGLGFGIIYIALLHSDPLFSIGFLQLVELSGYIAFLVALIRLKVFR
jgi:hypothetical protein